MRIVWGQFSAGRGGGGVINCPGGNSPVPVKYSRIKPSTRNIGDAVFYG